MTLTHRNNQWYKETPLDPAILYAAETASGHLLAIKSGGVVTVDGVELSDPNSAAFTPYPIMHSGESAPVVESNGYVTAAWMGQGPDPGYGTPVYVGVWKPGRDPVRYLLHFAGAVLESDPAKRRGIDNHCLPQLFVRESDKRVVYLSGGHHTTLYCGVSGSPHAAYNFHRLHPVGPQSDYPSNGHTYPAARMVGDNLHVVSRFTNDGYQFHLVYWSVDTKTMQPGKSQVLDTAPADHSYAIWYQQPRIEGGKLVIDTNRRFRKKGEPDTVLSAPEPKTYEVVI